MAPQGGHAGRVRPPSAPGRDQRLTTHLTVDQRLDWLQTRIAELRLWVDREWVDLVDWTFDGAPIAVGARWPDRTDVHRIEHPSVTPPWPDGRLELDLGGEGLVTLAYADGETDHFGLDAEHRSFPLRAAPFAIAVETVARLPFGSPNREARLARARITLIDAELERLALRLQLIREAARDHELIDAAAAALAVLRWPSATRPYLSRQAGTPFMRELWEPPAGLDPQPAAAYFATVSLIFAP